MAKYTMLFSEYIEQGGELPAAFAEINGFDDLFKMHYFNCEIGFETPLIFAMKLEEYANLYMTAYAQKLTRLATAYGLFDTGAKVRYTTDNNTYTTGAQRGTTTELPIDAETAEPSIVNATEQYTNQNSIIRNEQETGGTLDELQRRVEFLNTKAHNIIVDLLKEFKPLFMAIY